MVMAMKMENEQKDFTHRGKISGFRLTGRIRPENSPAEGSVTLDLKTTDGKDLKLECFVYESEPDDLHTGKLNIGDTVGIRFGLLNDRDNVVKVTQGKKYILHDTDAPKSVSLGGINYIAEGEILRIDPDTDNQMAKYQKIVIVDCGIYLCTRVRSGSTLRIGDYIKTKGRLDAHILGMVYEK